MKLSIGDFAQDLFLTTGIGDSLGAIEGGNTGGKLPVALEESAAGYGAPRRTHSTKSPICCAVSRFFGGICKSALPYFTASISRLFSGSPGAIAGLPESPPRSAASR